MVLIVYHALLIFITVVLVWWLQVVPVEHLPIQTIYDVTVALPPVQLVQIQQQTAPHVYLPTYITTESVQLRVLMECTHLEITV